MDIFPEIKIMIKNLKFVDKFLKYWNFTQNWKIAQNNNFTQSWKFAQIFKFYWKIEIFPQIKIPIKHLNFDQKIKIWTSTFAQHFKLCGKIGISSTNIATLNPKCNLVKLHAENFHLDYLETHFVQFYYFWKLTDKINAKFYNNFQYLLFLIGRIAEPHKARTPYLLEGGELLYQIAAWGSFQPTQLYEKFKINYFKHIFCLLQKWSIEIPIKTSSQKLPFRKTFS